MEATTAGRSPAADPLDGAPVQPHAEPVGHLLGDLGPRVGVGADEVHDLWVQLYRAATAAPPSTSPAIPDCSNAAATR